MVRRLLLMSNYESKERESFLKYDSRQWFGNTQCSKIVVPQQRGNYFLSNTSAFPFEQYFPDCKNKTLGKNMLLISYTHNIINNNAIFTIYDVTLLLWIYRTIECDGKILNSV